LRLVLCVDRAKRNRKRRHVCLRWSQAPDARAAHGNCHVHEIWCVPDIDSGSFRLGRLSSTGRELVCECVLPASPQQHQRQALCMRICKSDSGLGRRGVVLFYSVPRHLSHGELTGREFDHSAEMKAKRWAPSTTPRLAADHLPGLSTAEIARVRWPQLTRLPLFPVEPAVR
jgi:hypothetical protein